MSWSFLVFDARRECEHSINLVFNELVDNEDERVLAHSEKA